MHLLERAPLPQNRFLLEASALSSPHEPDGRRLPFGLFEQ
jgi:hypothetical protein